jgi:hypothetical protein
LKPALLGRGRCYLGLRLLCLGRSRRAPSTAPGRARPVAAGFQGTWGICHLTPF